MLDTTDEKLDFLEHIEDIILFDDEMWNTVAGLSEDNSGEVRMRVAERLFGVTDKRSEDILLRLADDADYLVRCEACTSLQTLSGGRVAEKLMQKTNDAHYLVRGYAAMSAAAAAENESPTEKAKWKDRFSALLDDPSEWVKIAALYSLILIQGGEAYEEALAGFINSADCHSRMFVLTLLDELLEKEKLQDRERIVNALSARLADEENRQISMKMDRLLKKCRES